MALLTNYFSHQFHLKEKYFLKRWKRKAPKLKPWINKNSQQFHLRYWNASICKRVNTWSLWSLKCRDTCMKRSISRPRQSFTRSPFLISTFYPPNNAQNMSVFQITYTKHFMKNVYLMYLCTCILNINRRKHLTFSWTFICWPNAHLSLCIAVNLPKIDVRSALLLPSVVCMCVW